MLTVPRIILLCVAVAALLGISAGAPTTAPGQQAPRPNTPIEHFVVIQLENWSFDSLFGTFPGADGYPRAGTPTPYPQTDKSGVPLTGMQGPLPQCTTPTATGTPTAGGPTRTATAATATRTATPDRVVGTATPPGCFPLTMAPVPYDFATYADRTRHAPPDSIHEFYREQFQIRGGRMDQFPIWNDELPCTEYCPGGSMGYWDLAALPTTTPSIGHYARQYTLMDQFHHGIFGASVPNWFWLI